jgi:hypothetical protein
VAHEHEALPDITARDFDRTPLLALPRVFELEGTDERVV